MTPERLAEFDSLMDWIFVNQSICRERVTPQMWNALNIALNELRPALDTAEKERDRARQAAQIEHAKAQEEAAWREAAEMERDEAQAQADLLWHVLKSYMDKCETCEGTGQQAITRDGREQFMVSCPDCSLGRNTLSLAPAAALARQQAVERVVEAAFSIFLVINDMVGRNELHGMKGQPWRLVQENQDLGKTLRALDAQENENA